MSEQYIDCTGFDLTHPLDIHFNNDESFAYVTCDTVSAVYVISNALRSVVGKVSDALIPFNTPSSMDINLNSTPNTAYVGNQTGGPSGTGFISIINMAVNIVEGIVNDSAFPINLPYGLAISDDGTTLLIDNFNGGNIGVVDTSTNIVTQYVSDSGHVINQPLLGAWSGSTKAYVTDLGGGPGMGFVTVVEGTALTGVTVNGKVSVGAFPPFSMPLNAYEGPDGTIYVTDFGNNNVYVINPSTDAVTTIFSGTFNKPLGVLITPDNTTAYVCNSGTTGLGSNTVSIVDLTMSPPTQTGIIDSTGFPFSAPYALQFASTELPPPSPERTPLQPICINGKQKTDRFAAQSELYNTISWCPSPSMGAVKYNLYRNGVLIKSINANDELTYEEHDVTEAIVYSVTAVNSFGEESPAVSVSLD